MERDIAGKIAAVKSLMEEIKVLRKSADYLAGNESNDYISTVLWGVGGDLNTAITRLSAALEALERL